MRVLYIVPMLSPDTSWGRWFIGLAEQVRPQGVEPVLLVPPSQAKYLESVPSLAGLQAHAVYPERYLRFFMSRRGPAAIAEMPGWLRRLPDFGEIDLIHSTEAYPWAWYARAIARRLGKPYIFSIRGDYGWIAHRRVPDKWMYAAVIRDAAAICPVSHGCAGRLAKAYPRTSLSAVKVIHNAADVESLAPAAEAHRRRPAGHRFRMVTVARLSPVKGLETSIAAFVAMRDAGIDGEYHIIGKGTGGSYQRELEALVPEVYRRDLVFLGGLPFSEVVSEYAAADVFVLTSRAVGDRVEGFGTVTLEAAACGVPAIVTRSGGLPEGVSDGSSGFVCEENEVAAVAQALCRLATDADLAQQMSENALAWARGFDESRRAAEYLEVYERAVTAASGQTIDPEERTAREDC
jgi:glycosyltransferase involved in cell wall biosynthesis